MANKLTRMDIVREAREWINTPFKHQGALKGVACDCIGLIKAIGSFANSNKYTLSKNIPILIKR
ncbi:MAG: hypothetical protein EBZ69_06345 [Alphaproteobacteria bacterium]|nr:hypothetical protein [Alphaproteobacteria bacterium]